MPVAIAVVVVGLLGYWAFLAIGPIVQCAATGVPSSSSGTECYQGAEYYFTTIAPPAAGVNASTLYHGMNFSLSSVGSAAGPQSVVASVQGPQGTSGQLALYALGGSSSWQTSITPDGNAGIQAHGGDLGSIRLLVAVNPQPAAPPTPDILL